MEPSRPTPRVNYDLFDLRSLSELAKQGSFNKAADALALTPSALSRRIAKLEEAIGGPLVIRTTRKMELTEIGRKLVERTRPLLHSLDDHVADAARTAHGLEGQIAISCIATVAFSRIPSAIAAFKEKYPQVKVTVKDGEGAGMTAAVREFEVDFAISTVPDDGLYCEWIRSDPLVLVCGKDHALASRQVIRWTELHPFKLLGFKSHVSIRQLVDRSLRAAEVELPWFYEVGSLAALLGALRSQQFVAPVPLLLANSLPELAIVELMEPSVARDIYLIKSKSVLTPPATFLWQTVKSLLAT